MATVVVFDFVNSDSGYVQRNGSNYAFAVGWDKCDIDKKPLLNQEKRTVMRFDTSSLPDTAIISKAEFYRVDRDSQGTPAATATDVRLGAWCGASLDASANDFAGGTSLGMNLLAYAAETWVNLVDNGVEPGPLINRVGMTDLAILNATPGTANSFYSFNNSRAKCRLRITYTVPSATATGRGTAAAVAKVTVAGRGTATGNGTAQVSATVRSTGVSSATGRGTAHLGATVAASASIAATGRGTAQVEAVVTAVGSAVVSGRGTAELIAAVIVAGVATAAGRGAVEIIAWVTVSGIVSATGLGTAGCGARVEERTASATATGRGFAICHLTAIYFAPLARHFGTRSVRVGTADARSVSRVHNATRVCAADDEHVRGARRLS